MKKYLALLTLLISPVVALAASFEGKVTMKMTAPRGEPQEMQYSMKGDKVRIEIRGQNMVGGMIMDTAKKEMLTIMDEQKMYMVMPIPDAAEVATKGRQDDVTLEKTGETETILGYKAEKYIATSRDGKSEMWLAEGIGTFMGMNNGGGRGRGAAPQAWERALAGKELFPLRIVGLDRGGKETFRLDVTAIEKQSLPDSFFAPPAGYQKMDMGGMLRGMVPGMFKR